MNAVLAHSIVRSLCFVVLMLAVPVGTGWSATVEVYYSPDDAPLDRLATLYGHAHRYLYVAVYVLTSPRAVEAMVAAKKRGVDVRLITDSAAHRGRQAAHGTPYAGVSRHSHCSEQARWADAPEAGRDRR